MTLRMLDAANREFQEITAMISNLMIKHNNLLANKMELARNGLENPILESEIYQTHQTIVQLTRARLKLETFILQAEEQVVALAAE